MIDPYIHLWDEQFHALVAKNMMEHPFTPMMYANPVLEYDYTQWWNNHVWLHKQPLFLWCIAISYKIFGLNEFALRLPFALMSSAMILMIYRMGKLIISRNVGFISSLLFGFSCFQLELVTGGIHTDHNDTFFMFFVTASIWSFTEYYNSGKQKWIYLIGLFAGMAVLVKWLTGLLVFSGWGLLILFDSEKRFKIKSYKEIAISFLIALFVFMPWQLYIMHYFPKEAAYVYEFNRRHITEALEGHAGSAWFQLSLLGEQFGLIVPYLLVFAIFFFYKNSVNKKIAIVFLFYVFILYAFFAFVTTKMPLVCLAVAPIIYIMLASLISEVLKFIQRLPKAKMLVSFLLLLLITFYNFDMDYIEQNHTERNPGNYVRRIAIHNREINKSLNSTLPSLDYVVFNCGGYNTTLVMFYSDVTAYGAYPTEEEYKKLKSKKIKMATFTDENIPDYFANDAEVFKIKEKIIPVH